MGYYTNYSLSIDDSVKDKSLLEKLDKEIERMDVFECGSFQCHESYYANAKWYDYVEDMCALSYRFPGILFTLYGVGEEEEDLWVCYFRDGKYQYEHARIEYEAFDENNLIRPINQDVYSDNRPYSYE